MYVVVGLLGAMLFFCGYCYGYKHGVDNMSKISTDIIKSAVKDFGQRKEAENEPEVRTKGENV